MKKMLILLAVVALLFTSCAATPEERVQIHNDADGLYTITIGQESYSQLEQLNKLEDCGSNGNITGAWIYGKTKDETEYTPILLVQTKEGLTAQLLDVCATYYPLLYAADVDGDKEDEVIVNNVRTAMGTGQYRLQVFAAEASGLTPLYSFPKTAYTYHGTDADIPYDELNFGFHGYLRDGFRLFVEYPALRYEETISLRDATIDASLWDENGQTLAPEEDVLRFNTFHSVDVLDIDDDGVFEIVGKQHVSYGTKRSIGVMAITLQFNKDAGDFAVVQVAFEPQE